MYCIVAVFPVLSPTCHRRRESRSPTSSYDPTRGRGRFRFFGSAIATARSMSSSLYTGVRASTSTVSPSSTLSTLTTRMSTVSLLFVVAFLMLLALGNLSLSRIAVLVLNHTLMIHVVVLFPCQN